MSKIKVNSIEAATGSTVTLPSGQTLDLSSGTVTLPNSSVNLTTKVTGTLPVANGGTGLTTLGSATQVLRVNSGATALEFGTVGTTAGQVIQVVSTNKTDTSSTSSTSFVDVSGLSVSITPSSASNKILIIASVSVGNSNSVHRVHLQLAGGNTSTYIGDAGGGGLQVAMTITARSATEAYTQLNGTMAYLDSPNTTSAITYKVQFMSSGTNTAYINRTGVVDGNTGNGASTITVMEIKG